MGKLSPMMEQYFEIKDAYKDCLLMFRLGDFYELFYDDALTASRELEITLTGRDCGQESRAPMCGVPHHAADGYIARLVAKGYKVAICEQVEDAKLTKTIVKREVVRVITPGTIIDSNVLDTEKNNFLVCIYEDLSGFGVSYSDISTGEFGTVFFEPLEHNKLIDHLATLAPKEIIVNDEYNFAPTIQAIHNVKPAVYSVDYFDYDRAYKTICQQFGVLTLHGIGLHDKHHLVCASGALFKYLKETQKNSLEHIFSIKIVDKSKFLSVDSTLRKNLELCESMNEKTKKGSLLWVLDDTKTAMGARLMRKWVEKPLINENDINKRLDAVSEYKDDVLSREELKEYLRTIHDFERVVAKLVYKNANARDLVTLKKSFENFTHIKTLLKNFRSDLSNEIFYAFEDLSDIYALINETIADEPPVTVRDGGMIKDGVNAQLDLFREAKNKGTTWLLEMETAEKEKTGIKMLKIRYNKVFGYYIEITNSNKAEIPAHYVRRQTLSNCERYTTEGLKEIEEAILGADEKIGGLEFTLFMETAQKVLEHLPRIQLAASIIATVDVLQSLANVADKNHYIRPTVNDSGVIDIREGRHPVIELLISQPFVPNDAFLDSGSKRVSIITGPNMAGKSTFMRQTALIVFMAQIGSFIPAESAEIGVVDKIFTRVGASDDLGSGQSTFMVEMSEVANILNNSTANSLIILDEIGRGTSTFDGLSIAWATIEFIAAKIGAKTLFATHYHELTELEGKVYGVNNYSVLVQEKGAEVVFLRKIVKGGTDNSYGIYVAKLAGVPYQILGRAEEILKILKNADVANTSNFKKDPNEVVYYGNKTRADFKDDKVFIQQQL